MPRRGGQTEVNPAAPRESIIFLYLSARDAVVRGGARARTGTCDDTLWGLRSETALALSPPPRAVSDAGSNREVVGWGYGRHDVIGASASPSASGNRTEDRHEG